MTQTPSRFSLKIPDEVIVEALVGDGIILSILRTQLGCGCSGPSLCHKYRHR